jgi:hypothetical protein
MWCERSRTGTGARQEGCALADGWTWEQVSEALGVTRQAVHKKHAKRLADTVLTHRRRSATVCSPRWSGSTS